MRYKQHSNAIHNIGFHLSVCSIGPVSHYIHEHKALDYLRRYKNTTPHGVFPLHLKVPLSKAVTIASCMCCYGNSNRNTLLIMFNPKVGTEFYSHCIANYVAMLGWLYCQKVQLHKCEKLIWTQPG